MLHETKEMMESIRNEKYKNFTENELVSEFKIKESDEICAEIFCRLYPLFVIKSTKYFSIPEEEKSSLALLFIMHSLRSYDINNARCKFNTYCIGNFERALIREIKSQNSGVRKANYNIINNQLITDTDTEFDVYMNTLSDISSEYDFEEVEFKIIYENLKLSDNQKKFINKVMSDKSDQEIADEMGISKMRVYWIRRSIKEKLSGLCIEDWDTCMI